MNKSITVEDVVRFAHEAANLEYRTLAQESSFTVRPSPTGIRFDLPSGAVFQINRAVIAQYLDIYNTAPHLDRTKTTIYPDRLRERSYITRILTEIAHAPRPAHPGDEVDALNDLDEVPEGEILPARIVTASHRFERNQAVRRYIIDKAAGRCEYCDFTSFRMKGGAGYLEAHHIISLAAQGPDTVENVIALCPTHHREAHYGERAESLEQEFLTKMKRRTWKKPDQTPEPTAAVGRGSF